MWFFQQIIYIKYIFIEINIFWGCEMINMAFIWTWKQNSYYFHFIEIHQDVEVLEKNKVINFVSH